MTRSESLFKFFIQTDQDVEVANINTFYWTNQIIEHIENCRSLSGKQLNEVRLELVDQILIDAQMPRTFTNRKKCNEAIFAPFESEDVAYDFKKWLMIRIEDKKDVVKEVNQYHINKIDEMILNTTIANSNNCINYFLEEFKKATKRLDDFASENLEWRNPV